MPEKAGSSIDQEQSRLEKSLEQKPGLDKTQASEAFIAKVDTFQEKMDGLKAPDDVKKKYNEKMREFLNSVDASNIDALRKQLNQNLDNFFSQLTESIGKEKTAYTVKSGDLLSKIAPRCINKDGAPLIWKQLYEANKATIGDNPDLIKPNQVLKLPDGYVYFDESIFPDASILQTVPVPVSPPAAPAVLSPQSPSQQIRPTDALPATPIENQDANETGRFETPMYGMVGASERASRRMDNIDAKAKRTAKRAVEKRTQKVVKNELIKEFTKANNLDSDTEIGKKIDGIAKNSNIDSERVTQILFETSQTKELLKSSPDKYRKAIEDIADKYGPDFQKVMEEGNKLMALSGALAFLNNPVSRVALKGVSVMGSLSFWNNAAKRESLTGWDPDLSTLKTGNTMVDTAAYFVPFAGNMIDYNDARIAYQKGNMGEAALSFASGTIGMALDGFSALTLWTGVGAAAGQGAKIGTKIAIRGAIAGLRKLATKGGIKAVGKGIKWAAKETVTSIANVATMPFKMGKDLLTKGWKKAFGAGKAADAFRAGKGGEQEGVGSKKEEVSSAKTEVTTAEIAVDQQKAEFEKTASKIDDNIIKATTSQEIVKAQKDINKLRLKGGDLMQIRDLTENMREKRSKIEAKVGTTDVAIRTEKAHEGERQKETTSPKVKEGMGIKEIIFSKVDTKNLEAIKNKFGELTDKLPLKLKGEFLPAVKNITDKLLKLPTVPLKKVGEMLSSISESIKSIKIRLPKIPDLEVREKWSDLVKSAEGQVAKFQKGVNNIKEKRRLKNEQAEQEKAKREKAEKEKAEHEKAERKKAEREKAELEKAEKEKVEREKAEREKVEREKAKRESAERKKAEQEKAEANLANKYKIGTDVLVPRSDGSINKAKVVDLSQDGEFALVRWEQNGRQLEKTVKLTDLDATAKSNEALAKSPGDTPKEKREAEKPRLDINKKFETIAKDPSQPALTRKLLSDERLRPKEELDINGQKFYMGEILQTPHYQQSVMYVEKNGQMMPRVLYKSNSDGGWRSCPGYMGVYSKGRGIHYTQETKPHRSIVEYFDRKKESSVNYERDLIKEEFPVFTESGKNPVNTYRNEVTKYNDNDALSGPKKFMPGVSFDKDRTFSKKGGVDGFIKSVNKLPEGFTPNFNSRPKRTVKIDHTLLTPRTGEKITIETYEGELNGRKVDWNMAHDADGRVWIDSIHFTDGKINSYGVQSEVINTGGLTNKPLEYYEQSGALDSEYAQSFDDSYSDITPLLDKMAPIQQFRQSRGISRKTAAAKAA